MNPHSVIHKCPNCGHAAHTGRQCEKRIAGEPGRLGTYCSCVAPEVKR